MNSEQYLKDSEVIIDAISEGMKVIAIEHGLEFVDNLEQSKEAKESLIEVIKEYGVIFAIEQLEDLVNGHLFMRDNDSVITTAFNKISELKSKLTQN